MMQFESGDARIKFHWVHVGLWQSAGLIGLVLANVRRGESNGAVRGGAGKSGHAADIDNRHRPPLDHHGALSR
ncbi:hypothetical protein D9M68_963580 [compost metagenome]